MNKHLFLLTPGEWLGYGMIALNVSPTKIRYFTKWKIEEWKEGSLRCFQQIEKEGVEEPSLNMFCISDITEDSFSIELANQDVGLVQGNGKIEEERIFWVFPTPVFFNESEGFSGREEYILQKNGEYEMHGTFLSAGYEITVEGRLWKKMKDEG